MVELTTDGGRSWSKTKPGLTAIVRLKAYGDDSAFAIGADEKCRPTYAWITGPAEKWQRDSRRADIAWYRSPDNLDEVHAPGGQKSRPCGDSLVDFAGLGTSQAAVLCADGRIRTDEQDRSWKTVQSRSSVFRLSADDNKYVALDTRAGCTGVVVRRFDSSGTGLGSKEACRPIMKLKPDATVASIRYGQVWLWSGDRVLRY